MGVSPDCVAAVRDASGGKMSEADAAELIRRMESIRKAEEAKGNLDGLEDRVRAAAAEDARNAQIAAALQRKHAALAAIAFDRSLTDVERMVGAGLSRPRALLAVLEGTTRPVPGARASVAATAIAYRARYMERLNLALVRNPLVAKLVQGGDQGFARAVVVEMHELREGGQPGRTGNREAAELAKLYAEIADTARLDMNRHGATIGKLDGWTPQAHAFEKVVKVSADDWIGFILPRLDRERTFGGLSDEAARGVLRDIWTEIVTGVQRQKGAADAGEKVGPANLANSLARARALHFKDSAAWLSYAERFGGGNIHEAMIGHLNHAARSAAQLQRLGPNPEATLTRLRATLHRQVGADDALTPGDRASQAQALNPSNTHGRIGSAFAEISGLSSSPVSTRAAAIGTGLRAWMTLSKLTGAVLSSAPDLQLRVQALTYQGRPIAAAWMENARELLRGRGAGEQREIAALLDAGLDGIKGHITAAGLADDMPMGKAHKLMERLFRWQGQSWWTDAMKAGAARMLSRFSGSQAGKAFDALTPEFRRTLRQHNIGAAEWDAVRGLAWTAEDGHTYLTPDRVAALPRAELVRLAKPGLDSLSAGLAERVARRQAADAREAEWVRNRVQRFEAGLVKARQVAEATSKAAAEGAERRRGKLRVELDAVSARLRDLVEFQEALAEGREWTPREEGEAPVGTPAAERYLHTGDPATLATRAEGELRARLAAVRRAIGRVTQEASRGDVRRLEGFDGTWGYRKAGLDEFLLRMEARAETRARATAAEHAAWDSRVDRVLEETRLDLEIRFRRFFADEMGFAVLEPDAQTRRSMLWGTRPGTLPGELLRTMMQFKGYPVAFGQRVFSRAMRGYDPTERVLQARHLGSLIGGLIVLGFVSMTLKDLSRGYGPRDPTRRATILAALAQSGGAGIYGDFLFAQANRFGNGPLETAAGPLPASAANILGLFLRAREGEARAGEALNLVLNNTPFVGLWYARPVMDYLVLNSLREAMSPGFWSKQRRNRRQEFGQESLYPAMPTIWNSLE